MLIIGSIAFDTIETPFVKRSQKSVGGSAVYASLVGSLFSSQAVIGVVGKDFFSAGKEIFSGKQIDTSGVKILPGLTMTWHGKYEDNLDERTTVSLGLNVVEFFNPKLSAKHKKEKVAFLGNINPRLQLQVYSQLNKPRLVALDTMNHWIENYQKDLVKVLPKVNILFVNDSEAYSLSKKKNLTESAEAILKLMGKGDKTLVIKQGGGGVSVFQKGKKLSMPAFPVKKLVDTTGAGDSFAGGFLGYLETVSEINWAAIKQAARVGTVAASFCVEKFGVKGLVKLNKGQILKRISVFKI